MSLPIINCDDCGACCRHVVRPPFYEINDPAWERLMAERPDLAAELDADLERRIDEGGPWDDEPCAWYDAPTRRCRHHEYRPEICHDFEVGGEDCREARVRVGLEG